MQTGKSRKRLEIKKKLNRDKVADFSIILESK